MYSKILQRQLKARYFTSAFAIIGYCIFLCSILVGIYTGEKTHIIGILCFWLLYFVGYLMWYYVVHKKYQQANVPDIVFTQAEFTRGRLICETGQHANEYLKRHKTTRDFVQILNIKGKKKVRVIYRFQFDKVKKVKIKKDWMFFFLKGRKFVVINSTRLSKEERQKIINNIRKIPILKRTNCTILKLGFVAISSIVFLCYISNISFGTKGIKINQLVVNAMEQYRNSVLCKAYSMNSCKIYKNGINDILERIYESDGLPEHLTVNESAEAVFTTDGTILSFSASLNGYDKLFHYVGNYKIRYSGGKWYFEQSNENSPVEYKYNSDFMTFAITCRTIPFSEIVTGEQGTYYKISYRGWRAFEWSKKIYNIDGMGRITGFQDSNFETSGPTVTICQGKNVLRRYIYTNPALVEDVEMKEFLECEKEGISLMEYVEKDGCLEKEDSVKKAELEKAKLEKAELEKNEQEYNQLTEKSRVQKKQISIKKQEELCDKDEVLTRYGSCTSSEEYYQDSGNKKNIFSVVYKKLMLNEISSDTEHLNDRFIFSMQSWVKNVIKDEWKINKIIDLPMEEETYIENSSSFKAQYNCYVESVHIMKGEIVCITCCVCQQQDGEKKLIQRKTFTFVLESTEPLELQDIIGETQLSINELINKYATEEQGFYSFENGETIGDLWVTQNQKCGYYFQEDGLVILVDKNIFPVKQLGNFSVAKIFLPFKKGELEFFSY